MPVKCILPSQPLWLGLLSILRRWFCCCWLLLPLCGSVVVLSFVLFSMRCFVSILVLQSSCWGRESWLLCFVCLFGVSWLLCSSSSWCNGLSPYHTHILYSNQNSYVTDQIFNLYSHAILWSIATVTLEEFPVVTSSHSHIGQGIMVRTQRTLIHHWNSSIGQDKQILWSQNCEYFLIPSILTL